MQGQAKELKTASSVNKDLLDRAYKAAEQVFSDKMKARMFRIGVAWALDALIPGEPWRANKNGKNGTCYFVPDPVQISVLPEPEEGQTK